jgi:hypothetical protein
MSLEIVEMTVKCRVPLDEAEDYIIKLRRGEEKLPVPPGFSCRDAFDCHDTSTPTPYSSAPVAAR